MLQGRESDVRAVYVALAPLRRVGVRRGVQGALVSRGFQARYLRDLLFSYAGFIR